MEKHLMFNRVDGSKAAAVAAGFLAAALVVSAGVASAQSAKPVAGTLTCKSKGTVGMILGSKEGLSCSYDPAGKGRPQPYFGTLTKYGLDLGVSGETVMIWTILGSSSELPDGALAGTYGGVSAEAAVGLGVGANALVGGSKNSIVLQPLSVEGQTGMNIAVGVAELTLRPR
jgi:hypothetical protein